MLESRLTTFLSRVERSDLVAMFFVIAETLSVRICRELESASIDFSSNVALFSAVGDRFSTDFERDISRELSGDLSELFSGDKSHRLLVLLNTGEIVSDSDELGVSYESVKRFLLTFSLWSTLDDRVITLPLVLVLCLRFAAAMAPFGGIMAGCQGSLVVVVVPACGKNQLRRGNGYEL